jgi:NADH:ubiquinone oxidoreductase subunit E
LQTEKVTMPNRSMPVNEEMRKWVVTALKAGADSPRRVLEWIAQNADKRSPSIPTISKIMREEGYEPVGYIWEKVKGGK